MRLRERQAAHRAGAEHDQRVLRAVSARPIADALLSPAIVAQQARQHRCLGEPQRCASAGVGKRAVQPTVLRDPHAATLVRRSARRAFRNRSARARTSAAAAITTCARRSHHPAWRGARTRAKGAYQSLWSGHAGRKRASRAGTRAPRVCSFELRTTSPSGEGSRSCRRQQRVVDQCAEHALRANDAGGGVIDMQLNTSRPRLPAPSQATDHVALDRRAPSVHTPARDGGCRMDAARGRNAASLDRGT